MERIRELDRYPKLLLLALLMMAVVFAAVYGITASRVGYLYNDTILVPRQSEGALVYEGKVDGLDSSIVVALDTVIVNWGSKTYGPYTVREDSTAVPEDVSFPMTGIEILDGDKVFFRGGVTDEQEDFWLIDKDGSSPFMMTYTMGDGIEYDMDGNPIDPLEPAPYDIVSLLRGPELTHKGQWPIYLLALFCSALAAVSILFADELFRFSLSFRVRDAYSAEPSDWEIASRTIGWTILTGMILLAYCMGLR